MCKSLSIPTFNDITDTSKQLPPTGGNYSAEINKHGKSELFYSETWFTNKLFPITQIQSQQNIKVGGGEREREGESGERRERERDKTVLSN